MTSPAYIGPPPRYQWQPRGYGADELRQARALVRALTPDDYEDENDAEAEPGAEVMVDPPPRQRRARRAPRPAPATPRPGVVTCAEWARRTGVWPRKADGSDMLVGYVDALTGRPVATAERTEGR